MSTEEGRPSTDSQAANESAAKQTSPPRVPADADDHARPCGPAYCGLDKTLPCIVDDCGARLSHDGGGCVYPTDEDCLARLDPNNGRDYEALRALDLAWVRKRGPSPDWYVSWEEAPAAWAAYRERVEAKQAAGQAKAQGLRERMDEFLVTTQPAANGGTKKRSWAAEARKQLKQALELADRGFHVFPVDHPSLPRCRGWHKKATPCDGDRGKHPVCRWPEWSTTDPERLAQPWYFGGEEPRNIGIDCGKSGIVVLDEDEDGALREASADLGFELPATYRVGTARGQHVYLYRNGHQLGNAAGALRPYKIDVRGDGGYVVAAGSLHESGVIYEVSTDERVGNVSDELAELLTRKPRTKAKTNGAGRPASDHQWAEDEIVPKGQRHTAVVSVAGLQREMGRTREEATAELRRLHERMEQPPGDDYPWEEVVAQLDDVYERYEAGVRREDLDLDWYRKRDEGTGALKLWSIADLEEMTPPRWRIEDIMPDDSLTVLFGESGTYKSFIALSWALSIASGTPWLGRAARQGRTIYIAAEGGSGLLRRIKAWQAAHPDADPTGHFAAVPHLVDLRDPRTVESLHLALEELDAPATTFIDTWSRNLPGANENSAEHTSEVIGVLDDIKGRFGGGMAIVHHAGLERGRERGSTVLRGAADCRWESAGKPRSLRALLRNPKMKEWRETRDIVATLDRVGDSITGSLVVRSAADPCGEHRAVIEGLIGKTKPLTQTELVLAMSSGGQKPERAKLVEEAVSCAYCGVVAVPPQRGERSVRYVLGKPTEEGSDD